MYYLKGSLLKFNMFEFKFNLALTEINNNNNQIKI